MIQDYITLAIRNISHRKLRSWLTMLGIFIGIAAVVSLISLGDGLRDAMFSVFANVGSDKITVTPRSAGFSPPGSFTSINLDKADVRAIEKVNGVKLVVGRILEPSKVTFKNQIDFTFVVSMPEDREAFNVLLEAINIRIEEGKIIGPGDGFDVVVGNNYANTKFDEKIDLREKIEINDINLKVMGILEKSGNFQIDDAVIMMENPMRDLFNIDEEFDAIVVQVEKSADLKKVGESIEKALRNHRNVDIGKEDFEVATPQQIVQGLDNTLTIVNTVLIGIAAISLVVGGIGITNTMYTAVLQRTREIGIMKAVGAKNKDILLLFLIESGMLGVAGGLIGLLIGIGLAKAVEIAGQQILGTTLLQASITPELLIGALVFSFLVGSMAGVFPARQAARQKPVESLRYE